MEARAATEVKGELHQSGNAPAAATPETAEAARPSSDGDPELSSGGLRSSDAACPTV